MMGTRAAAFAGKISNLRESILRIQNAALPQPTCTDLANMLKYFCQVFHDFRDFKDIENIPLYANEKQDWMELIKTLPNFDYCGLYRTLSQLIDILPLIPPSSNGLDQLGTNLLMLLKCLVPFLDRSNVETMPYLVATLFMSLPGHLHKDILDTLCFNLLPFTIDQQQRHTATMLRQAKIAQQQQQHNNPNQTASNLADLQPARRKRKSSSSRRRRRAARRVVSATSAAMARNKRPVHCVVRIDEGELAPNERAGLRQAAPAADDEDQGIGSDQDERRPARVARRFSESFTEFTDEENDGSDDGLPPDDEFENEEEDEYALLSITSILTIAFHYISEPMHHSQLVECLMKLKSDAFEDLLYVIAYGTARARCPAVEMLFKYWPEICPSEHDRKKQSQANKLKHVPWLPTKCQNRNCSLTTLGDDEAVKMCLDFKLSITLSGLPPPMLVCLDCVDSIYKQQVASSASLSVAPASGGPEIGPHDEQPAFGAIENYSGKFIDLLLPMERVSKFCENKKCKSTDRTAVGTCFDIECANYNCKKPIRYCKSCLTSIHEPCAANNYDVTLATHIWHSSLTLTIMRGEESINTFVEAIISLLKEAAPIDRPSKDSERYLRSLMSPTSQFNQDQKDGLNNIATEEKQLISQYGIWLMTGLCKRVERLSDDLLGRLLGMLFQWFHFTACLPDDQAGSALEKLKGECIKGWIMGVKSQRLDVFISCLLPHPIDCSKIGGHWEVWPDTAHQIKEGFKRLLCLVPYDIITDDVWDEIMPYWMECFRHEVPENELNELKILLSKVFDPELSPLGFETKQMYNFISSRFEDSSNTNQEQTLYWLQIITMLEIPIPINFLFEMLKSGVQSLATIRQKELGRIKIASRLEALDKPEMSFDSPPGSKSHSRRSSRHSSPDRSASSSAASLSPRSQRPRASSQRRQRASLSRPGQAPLAVQEQDPVEPEDDNHQGSEPSAEVPESPTLAKKERQNQARAAFSARILQHASMLDAKHAAAKGQDGPQACTNEPEGQATSVPKTTTMSTGSLGESAKPKPQSQQSTSLRSQPLQSAQSQASSTKSAAPLTRDPSKSSEPKREQATSGRQAPNATGRPKLRLQLSSVEEALSSRVDNNLICYILMLDILIKQLDLQEIGAHRGLSSKEAQLAMELLNSIIATPWLGRHTCDGTLSTTMSSSSTGDRVSSNDAQQDSKPGSSSRASAPARQDTSSDLGPRGESHGFGHCAQGFEHEDSFETCVFCEIISTFHQLAMSLIEFFSPVIEVSICEVSQDAANGEFDGQPDYYRMGQDHLNFSDDMSMAATQATIMMGARQASQKQEQEPPSPFSPSYLGPFLKQEALSALPNELQLCYNLLVQFHQYQTPDIVSQLLQMIKLLTLHSQVLSRAAKSSPQFIAWCQHNMLVGKLWALCQLESSEIARTCVPLLLHCITLPWGVRLFRDLVERDFNSKDWLARFGAVERVVTIAYFCEPSTIKNSTLLQSTMASAFCYLARCLDDIEAIVAQRALVSLEMMKTSSLKLLLWCLEVQFDYIIIDRPMILRSVFQLYNHLKDRRFLTWDFFLNRFDAIFLEAQIHLQLTGEMPSFSMQDLKNTNTKSEIYQKKIVRAREALQETHHSRSLSCRLAEVQVTSRGLSGSTSSAGGVGTSTSGGGPAEDELVRQARRSMKLQRQMQGGSTDSAFLSDPVTAAASSKPGLAEGAVAGRRAGGLGTSPLKRIMQYGSSTSSRYQSVAYLTSQALTRRKNSKFMANLALQSVPPSIGMLPDKLHQHLPNTFVDDGSKLNEIAQENHAFGVVHRVGDEDRDTNHLLIFLLMQFFSKPDPSHPQSVKTLNRSHQIVLRHLSILMGYSVARKNFLISATNLRILPVFNAFLTSLPKVLDFNYSLGTILLDTCLPVLVYCPAPDDAHYDLTMARAPTYSLWLLNPLMRQSWLMSVMAFLYKYQFGEAHLKEHVQALMWIVINTLESHLTRFTLDAAALDKCLNLGAPSASTGGQQAGGKQSTAADEHQPVESPADGEPPGPLEPAGPEQAACESTGRGAKDNALTPRRLQQSSAGKAAALMGVAHSTSNASLRNNPPQGGAAASLSPTAGSPEPPASASSKAALMKADTSDSLLVKAKIFQRGAKTGAGSVLGMGNLGANANANAGLLKSADRLGSAGASSTRISSMMAPHSGGPPVPAPSRVEPASGRAGRAQPTGAAHDELLLPIGLGAPTVAKTRSAFDLPAAERLLPIGASKPKVAGARELAAAAAASSVAGAEAPSKLAATEAASSAAGAQRPRAMSPPSCSSEQLGQQRPPAQMGPQKQQQHQPPPPPHQQQQVTSSKLGASAPAVISPSSDEAPASLAGATSTRDLQTVHDSPALSAKSLATQKRGRFGTKSGAQPAEGAGARQTSRDQQDSDSGKPPTPAGGAFGARAKTKAAKHAGDRKQTGAGAPSGTGAVLKPSYSNPSLLNEQLVQINRHSIVQEFSDKDLSMCLVILETFIHHEPSMAAAMLPNILRLIARYSLAGQQAWQSGNSTHLVGGSMFVARQFIRVALHDLMENNIFQQIFTSHFTGHEFYKSMATALADFPELNQLAPLSKLFEDLNKQKNLPQVNSLLTILENVATYFECIIAESTTHSQSTWNNFVNNWENFLRKLILALPRFTGLSLAAGSAGGGGAAAAAVGVAAAAAAAAGSAPGGPGGAGSGAAQTGAPGGLDAGAAHPLSLGGAGGAGGAPGNQLLGRPIGGAGAGVAPGAGGPVAGSGEPSGAASSAALAASMASSCSLIMSPIMRIILATTKISHLASCKTIVDPYSKIISYTVLNSPFKYEHLLEINHNCCRLYARDREKYLIQRTIAYELVQDVGGTLAPRVLRDGLKLDQSTLKQSESYITNVSECLRQYIGDLLEFITDVHAISRINDNLIGAHPASSCVNRDSFGGHVKAAISQYLALEMSLASGDNRAILRYLPWLYASPSLQQGPREFIDCVSHIRQLSWIILGSLQHATLMKMNAACGLGGSAAAPPSSLGGGGGGGGACTSAGAAVVVAGASGAGGAGANGAAGVAGSALEPATPGAAGLSMGGLGTGASSSQVNCQPIPLAKNGNVAEHVQVILAGFAEQSKESVLHMSGLFHAFLLCQLWTMYCENICSQHPAHSEQYQFCQSTLDDFWAKITPGVLRLVSHSRVMSEMVSTHFLQLIESLIESNSSVLIRYLPMWNSVFYSYKRRNKSGNIAIRLQKCIEWQPPDLSELDTEQNNKRLVNWLEKVQYKMSHIEIQSSQAAPFYLT